MSTSGLLIDYEYCTGCHACEVACKVEKGLEEGQFGIKLAQIGPEMIDEENEKWDWDFVPMPTKRCDLCADRTKEGKVPACVHHCQSLVMEYGPVEELARKMVKPRIVLFSVD